MQYSENANEEDETSTCLNDGQQHELSYLDVKLRSLSLTYLLTYLSLLHTHTNCWSFFFFFFFFSYACYQP